jgi:hypothetical protein
MRRMSSSKMPRSQGLEAPPLSKIESTAMPCHRRRRTDDVGLLIQDLGGGGGEGCEAWQSVADRAVWREL